MCVVDRGVVRIDHNLLAFCANGWINGGKLGAYITASKNNSNFLQMALVVICGQPCSGKSTAALCLAEALNGTESKPTVRIIDETSFHLDRNHSYGDMTAEKNLRGVLRSEVDRSLSKDNIIIVDSLNSIKGYRYELWCLARAAGIRYCVLYCDVEVTHCRKWNEERRERVESSYNDKIFDDLVRRFEKPDRRNRWDSPLFELWPFKDGVEKSSPAIVDAVLYLTKKVDSKTKDVRVLLPTIATQTARVSEANSLYEMDRATQEVMSAIMEAQSRAIGGPVNRNYSWPWTTNCQYFKSSWAAGATPIELKWSTPTFRCRECKEDVCGLLEQRIRNCLTAEDLCDVRLLKTRA
ncbi:hypothetical protein HYC85_015660 [Camellia sinensis]|uniref:Protein KTI12 homolog n=1 Tax=Camellia sinensis TaxID=4442 RepID=A0A7J7GXC4_CAMSI|nr:hypothetical protein HYC85_015660 [Camellia sinensis]